MPADDLIPGPNTPKTPANFDGIVLAISAPQAPLGPVDVNGLFQIAEAKAAAIDAHPHRALTLVMTSADGTLVGTPYRERVFFEDDLERTGGLVRGCFRLRLVDPRQGIPPGFHWISMSLGEFLSNVVELPGGPASVRL